MTTRTMIAVVVGSLACSVATTQATLSLNYSSVDYAGLQFYGSAHQFGFTPGSDTQFRITSSFGAAGDSVGDLGFVGNGPWNYGSITTLSTPYGEIQSASVTSDKLGSLVLFDGLGGKLTGNVNWVQVATFGTAGAINGNLLVNVTDLNYAYTGSPESDLLTLALASQGSMNLSFQFNPGKTLSQLSTGSPLDPTSFSGSISSAAVPEPTTLIAGALLLLPFGASTIRVLRRKQQV